MIFCHVRKVFVVNDFFYLSLFLHLYAELVAHPQLPVENEPSEPCHVPCSILSHLLGTGCHYLRHTQWQCMRTGAK